MHVIPVPVTEPEEGEGSEDDLFDVVPRLRKDIIAAVDLTDFLLDVPLIVPFEMGFELMKEGAALLLKEGVEPVQPSVAGSLLPLQEIKERCNGSPDLLDPEPPLIREKIEEAFFPDDLMETIGETDKGFLCGEALRGR
jgi:hypothetical protein